MLDFRKALLALSVAGLGLVGTASAQVATCTAVAPTQGYEGSVAVEGMTEELPTVTITCNGQPVTGSLTLTLTANAPITNITVPNSNPSQVDVLATDNGLDTATVTQPATSTVQLTFASVTGNLSTITVEGIRVNPSGAPVLSQITLSLGSTSIPVSAQTANMAYVQKTLSSVTINQTAVPNQSACSLVAADTYPVANVQITNGFPGSFKTPSQIANGDGDVTVTQGTTFAVTFNNLNAAGVNYYVPAVITNAPLTLTAFTSAVSTTAATPVASPGAGTLILLTPNASGSATIYYQVTAAATSGTEQATISLTEAIPSTAAVTSYTSTPASVSILLVGPSTGYPEYSSSQTAYTATQTTSASGNGVLTPCSTTLLFPYLVNGTGFDTGVAITNASTGTGNASISPTTGSCSVTFYGTGAPTTNPYSTGSVTTGTTAAFDLSTAAPGFTGYAIAVCNFQGAHGYAFISYGLGSTSAVAANYLAVVLQDQNLASNAGYIAF